MTAAAGGSATGFPDAFVVSRAPGRAGRALLKLARGIDRDPRHFVHDGTGARIATVAVVTKALRKALDSYHRLAVLDGTGNAMLALRGVHRTLHVQDSERVEVGTIRYRNPVHTRDLNHDLVLQFHAPPEKRQFAPPGPVLGTGTPERPFPRGPFAFGAVAIVAADGAPVARYVNEDGFHTAVEILPETAEPLRTLVIACACSFVDDRWLRAPHRND